MILTIITINYNNLEGLKKTIQSVVDQTWKKFEFIVVDGGSVDGSLEYIESQNDNIDYWICESDNGVYNAMNKGILKANGKYLLFLNSGDHFYAKDVLENYNKFLDNKDLIYFNLNVVDKTNSWIRNYTEKLAFSYFLEDTLPHPSTFIKKTLFDKIGLFDENLKIVSDWKFFIECICKYNFSYLKIDQVLSTFYLDGLSSKPENQELIYQEKQQILQADFSAYLNDFKELAALKKTISNLKKSTKIRVLLKLRLLNKF